MFKNLLLTLPSYPHPVPAATLRAAVDVGRVLDAHITCLVSAPTIPLPLTFHPYSPQLERQLNERQDEVRAVAEAQLAAFSDEARRAGISHGGRVVVSTDDGPSEAIVEHARLRNLTIVPFIEGDETRDDLLQSLVFNSGRPVLVLPGGEDGRSFALNKVVVAWDFSRAAARAAGDALPLLRRAGEVRAVTGNLDKPMPDEASGPEFATHLVRNGVATVVLDEVELGTRTVGEAIDDASADADLLVMGAFGHSRLRDFFLGGATRHVLKRPRVPTLLSH